MDVNPERARASVYDARTSPHFRPPMKIVIAPDSFKESLTALAVATAVATGMRRVLPHAHYDLVPLADGGEGTVAALVAATAGELVEATVTGPLGSPVTAHYGLLGDGVTAVIEVAQASGLERVPVALRYPTRTTSYGTGELIRHALAHAPAKLIIGLGGSATSDGGAGLCQALGVRFHDRFGQLMHEPLSGGRLAEILSIDVTQLDHRLAGVSIEVACDVANPLTGEDGAAAVYGPQKGATLVQVALLERGLVDFYARVERQLGVAVSGRRGAGAAGGLGAAMIAFLGAELRPGIDLVIEAVDLRSRLRDAAVVITGEGRIDAQTLSGKTAFGVARLATQLNIPVIALGGSLADDADCVFAGGIDAIEASVCRPQTLAQALAEARPNIERAGRRIAQWLQLAARLC